MNIKGKIEEIDEISQTARIGTYKLGIKVASNWYGVFGTKDELEGIAKQAKVGAIADLDYEIRNTYRNVTAMRVQAEQGKSEPTQAEELEREKKALENYREQRIASFREDIEDAVKILEPWKEMMNPEIHWDKAHCTSAVRGGA